MALNKSSSQYNSRSPEITEIQYTVKPLNKTRSISLASLSHKSTKKLKPKEIKFRNEKFKSDNPSVSSMSIHGARLMIVLPDKYHIPCKI